LLRPPKVYSTAHFRLSDNVENLILQGNADLQGYGNGLSNALYGNSGNNPDRFRSSNPTTPASQSGLCGLRRSRCQIPISSLGRSAGCRSAAPRTARGSSGFPGLCRTCVPLEGHRDLLRRLVGSRPRCQVRWRIGFRVAGSRRISSSMKRQAFCIASIRVPSL
jgi:hypothetical protein